MRTGTPTALTPVDAVANLFMFCARTSGGRSLNGVVAELAEPERRATGRAVYRDHLLYSVSDGHGHQI